MHSIAQQKYIVNFVNWWWWSYVHINRRGLGFLRRRVYRILSEWVSLCVCVWQGCVRGCVLSGVGSWQCVNECRSVSCRQRPASSPTATCGMCWVHVLRRRFVMIAFFYVFIPTTVFGYKCARYHMPPRTHCWCVTDVSEDDV